MSDHKQPDLGEGSHMFLIDTGGGAWVTGNGFFSIPFRVRPIDPSAWFNDTVPMCGPIPTPSPGDWVLAEAVNEGHRFRPRWFLKVSWHIEQGVRLIDWSVEDV